MLYADRTLSDGAGRVQPGRLATGVALSWRLAVLAVWLAGPDLPLRTRQKRLTSVGCGRMLSNGVNTSGAAAKKQYV